MSVKVSITLDEEVLEFVDRSSKNRSQFINDVLSREKKRQLLKELAQAYTEQANDPAYLAEFQGWDVTVGDGIDAEG
jgi:metal-responsive CopG/Arc/MetJ family transcriptional regulator